MEHVPLLWIDTSSKVLRALPSPQFSGYESQRQFLVLQQEDFQDGKLKLHLAVDPAREGDYFSLAFARLTYLLPKTNSNTGPVPRRFTVEALQAVRFRNYDSLPANYLIVGHGQLEQPSQSYPNPVQVCAYGISARPARSRYLGWCFGQYACKNACRAKGVFSPKAN